MYTIAQNRYFPNTKLNVGKSIIWATLLAKYFKNWRADHCILFRASLVSGKNGLLQDNCKRLDINQK